MANPTTNYGFVLPMPTDLVTNLPADFEVALQGVDTQMFTNASAAVSATVIDAKGDLLAGTAADTLSRIAVGANATVLTADSAEATGMKWAAAETGGSMTLLSTTSLAGVTTVTVSSISQSYTHLQIFVQDFFFAANDKVMAIRFNGDSGSKYFYTFDADNTNAFATYGDLYSSTTNVNDGNALVGTVPFYADTTINKIADFSFIGLSSTGVGYYNALSGLGIRYKSTTAISSITLFCRNDTTNFTAGNLLIYGVK